MSISEVLVEVSDVSLGLRTEDRSFSVIHIADPHRDRTSFIHSFSPPSRQLQW